MLANAADISKCLGRPPQYLCKFMGLGVGALAAYHPAQGLIDLRGAFSEQTVSGLIKTFIRQWVLCGRCRLRPESE